MIYLSYDLETSGLDTSSCSIVEIGWVIWDSRRGVPLSLYSGLVRTNTPVPPASTAIHGITEADVETGGLLLDTHLSRLANDIEDWAPTRRVGHNILAFDDRILARLTPGVHPAMSLSPFDTKVDVPKWRNRKLVHALAEFAHLINPFAHRAVFDALSVCLLMQHGGVDIEAACRYVDLPKITFQSTQPFARNDEAKALGFAWSPDLKEWRLSIPESEVAELQAKADAANIRIRRA